MSIIDNSHSSRLPAAQFHLAINVFCSALCRDMFIFASAKTGGCFAVIKTNLQQQTGSRIGFKRKANFAAAKAISSIKASTLQSLHLTQLLLQ